MTPTTLHPASQPLSLPLYRALALSLDSQRDYHDLLDSLRDVVPIANQLELDDSQLPVQQLAFFVRIQHLSGGHQCYRVGVAPSLAHTVEVTASLIPTRSTLPIHYDTDWTRDNLRVLRTLFFQHMLAPVDLCPTGAAFIPAQKRPPNVVALMAPKHTPR